jgi:hypothetical protein
MTAGISPELHETAAGLQFFRVRKPAQLERMRAPLERVLAHVILEADAADQFTVPQAFGDLVNSVGDWPRSGVWVAFMEGRLVALLCGRMYDELGAPSTALHWAWSTQPAASDVLHRLVEQWARAQGSQVLRITRVRDPEAFDRLLARYGYDYHCVVFRKDLRETANDAEHVRRGRRLAESLREQRGPRRPEARPDAQRPVRPGARGQSLPAAHERADAALPGDRRPDELAPDAVRPGVRADGGPRGDAVRPADGSGADGRPSLERLVRGA